MNFCQFKNLLGEPRTGIHAIRIFDIAIADVLIVAICAYLLARWKNWNLWKTLIAVFAFGIFIHWLFCVQTKVNMMFYTALNYLF